MSNFAEKTLPDEPGYWFCYQWLPAQLLHHQVGRVVMSKNGKPCWDFMDGYPLRRRKGRLYIKLADTREQAVSIWGARLD